MEKVAFALDIEGGWPPVATEHVWCEKEGTIYELKCSIFYQRPRIGRQVHR